MYGGIKLPHQLRNSTFLDTHIYPKALWACSRITNPTFEWGLLSGGICSTAGTLSAAALTCTGCSFSWQREAQVRKVLKDRLVSFTSSEWLRAAVLCALLAWSRKELFAKSPWAPKIQPRTFCYADNGWVPQSQGWAHSTAGESI